MAERQDLGSRNPLESGLNFVGPWKSLVGSEPGAGVESGSHLAFTQSEAVHGRVYAVLALYLPGNDSSRPSVVWLWGQRQVAGAGVCGSQGLAQGRSSMSTGCVNGFSLHNLQALSSWPYLQGEWGVGWGSTLLQADSQGLFCILRGQTLGDHVVDVSAKFQRRRDFSSHTAGPAAETQTFQLLVRCSASRCGDAPPSVPSRPFHLRETQREGLL